MTDYPTRQEWAIRETTVYSDMENPQPASRLLSDYASAEETEAAITALKDSYRDFGRQMKVAEHEKKSDLQFKRHAINSIIKQIRKGTITVSILLFDAYRRNPLPTALDTIIQRYEAAERVAFEDWKRRVAATPVDDAAWQKELERRRDIQRYLKGKGLAPYYSWVDDDTI